MWRVTAGYVTVETAVPGGRARIDVQRGEVLPDDVPAAELVALAEAGHIEQAGPAPEPTKPKTARRSKTAE